MCEYRDAKKANAKIDITKHKLAMYRGRYALKIFATHPTQVITAKKNMLLTRESKPAGSESEAVAPNKCMSEKEPYANLM
jgi:hypothetical protein